MTSPFDYFDRVYCTHLPTATARLPLIQKQFELVGIKDVQYISAAVPPVNFTMTNMRRAPRGEFGHNLSMIKTIVRAISDGAKRPLFFEDDVVFHPNTLHMLEQALDELPEDWEVLYMGGHPTGPIFDPQATIHSEHLAKVGKMSFADSYSLNGQAMLIEYFDTWCDEVSKPEAVGDMILGRFASRHNSYCTYPLLCEQYPNMSSISLQQDDKSSCVARAWTHHLGDNLVTPEHLKIALAWRKQNPTKWQQLVRRKQQGHK